MDKYLYADCVVCGRKASMRYMFNDIPICFDCKDTDKFLEWLKENRPLLYHFECNEWYDMEEIQYIRYED